VLKLDVYHVDCPSHTPMRNGHPVDLTAKDFDLSVLSLRNVGQLLARGRICERVWGRSAPLFNRPPQSCSSIAHARDSIGAPSP